MNRGVFAAGCALVASVTLALSPASAHEQRFRNGDLFLAFRHDVFDGGRHCDLASRSGRVFYQPDVIGVLLGKRRDTVSAWYRIDVGAPVRWRDRTASLTGADFAIDGPGLDNSTGGWFWIPLSEVEGPKAVTIRANDRGRIHHFRLPGFEPMLADVRRMGCGSDDAFRI